MEAAQEWAEQVQPTPHTPVNCWLHSSHGLQEIRPILAPRNDGLSVAQTFASIADASETMLGVKVTMADGNLVTEDSGTVITPLCMCEVSCAMFPACVWPEMAAIAIVPPADGAGLKGTIVNGAPSAGHAAWFIVVSGNEDCFKVLDELSLLGALRTNLELAYFALEAGDAIIGEGAYATVYCMQARDGSEVAVKRMTETGDLESIEREVQMLLLTHAHPNCIGFRGIFYEEQCELIRFSIVFEVATHGDLLLKIVQNRPMEEATARGLFAGIMHGLVHTHSMGIVHRDIKAENILLKADDHPVVADFGLACSINDSVQMLRRCGSPGYVAPEVCLGSPYGFKVDVFGAGTVLYFMLSKDMPFSSPDRDTAATMKATVKCNLHLHRPPWDTKTTRLRNVLRQTICKSIDDRLSAQETLKHSWLVGGSSKTAAATADGQPPEEISPAAPQPMARCGGYPTEHGAEAATAYQAQEPQA